MNRNILWAYQNSKIIYLMIDFGAAVRFLMHLVDVGTLTEEDEEKIEDLLSENCAGISCDKVDDLRRQILRLHAE